jgi:hypothetical protein
MKRRLETAPGKAGMELAVARMVWLDLLVGAD